MGAKVSLAGMGQVIPKYCMHRVKRTTSKGTVYWVQCTKVIPKDRTYCRDHR